MTRRNGHLPSVVEAALPSEKVVLGACLYDCSNFVKVKDLLSGADFGPAFHCVIFGAMSELDSQGREWDVHSLTEFLKQRGELYSLHQTPVAYLQELNDTAPRMIAWNEHTAHIREAVRKRRLMGLGEHLVRDVEQDEDPSRMESDLRAFVGQLDRSPAARTIWDQAQSIDEYLSEEDEADEVWLIPGMLKRGGITQVYAPRGLGKSVWLTSEAIKLARLGKRILILDRDNPPGTVRRHLHALGGAGLDKRVLRVLDRRKCPPLTEPDKWATLPVDDYDAVLMDSLNTMIEGISEKDTAGNSLAIKCVLDLCYRGPGFLILGNTIRTAQHSRLNGVIEDRADIVFEVRDGTDFRPSGSKPWVEELPAQGAADWQARSSRRQGRKQIRLALTASKFRVEEEPSPRMLEINFAAEPFWTVRDVTAEVDAAGEQARAEAHKQKATRHAQAVAALTEEIRRRAMAGEELILKAEAEEFLKAKGFRRDAEARPAIADSTFERIPGLGKGPPIMLQLADSSPTSTAPNTFESTAQEPPSEIPNNHAGPEAPYLCGPLVKTIAKITPLNPA